MTQPIPLKDIRSGSPGSNPSLMDAVVWGGRLLLTADDGVRGRELWSTDGTSVGTRRVKDANPGPAGSDPSQLVVIGNRVFFQANDPAHGTELWSTDGTEQGTELVKDIHPVVSLSGLPLSSFPFDFTPFAGRLLFTADDGSNGGELWASDGTASGTRLVKSINPISYYRPRSLTVVGNQLLFFANDGANGEELWRTDSSLQTILLKDIFPGKDSGISDSGVLLGVLKTTLGERLLFTADNGEKGEELWISDGTSPGTFLLKDIHPGSQGTDISKPTLVGNQLFFMVDSSGSTPELWCTDGTTDGTRLVKSFPQGANAFDFSLSALPSGTLMLQRTNGKGAHELWRSTGTSAGTTQLKQINPGSGIASGSPNVMSTSSVVVGNKLFFSANDGKSGQELWVSDGTTAGTFLVKNIRPDLAGSSPRELTAVGNQVVFWANDGSTGEELWISNGTTVGTRPLADLNPGLPSATAPLAGGSSSFDPTIKVLSGNTIIFNADDGLNGIEPWALKISAPPPPSASVLAIAPLAATKAEATGGAVTPFTFQVSRSGKASGVSTAVWSVVGTGSKPANGADFSGGVLPRGTVSFAAGQTSRSITVNVRGDLLQEGDETFRVSLSAPTGAVLTTAAATGTILNDDLIGDAKANTLVGTARAEFLDGRANVDTLTGGRAADVFGFRFGESPLAAPDRITDFAFGTDKIDLLTASGGTLPAPGSFSRAANNSTAKSLGALAAAVFTDANGARAGNQALAAKSAALVRATHAAIAGTYLVVNNAVAGRSNSDDLMIKLNGFTGALPALGAIPINSVFL